MDQFTENATPLGLYDPQFEHDACGIGAVVDIKGRKSHQTVDDALRIVERLEHRAGLWLGKRRIISSSTADKCML